MAPQEKMRESQGFVDRSVFPLGLYAGRVGLVSHRPLDSVFGGVRAV